jgi:hypothetical protein
MTGVVISRRGGDTDRVGDRPGRPAEGADFFRVVSLGEKGSSQSHGFSLLNLVDQVSGRFGLAGEGIETEFGINDRHVGLLVRKEGDLGRCLTSC